MRLRRLGSSLHYSSTPILQYRLNFFKAEPLVCDLAQRPGLARSTKNTPFSHQKYSVHGIDFSEACYYTAPVRYAPLLVVPLSSKVL